MNFPACRLSAVALLALAGCTSMSAATRHGQPVIDTTIGAIFEDPDQWDGKWVRVSGWIDRQASLVVSKKGDEDDWWSLHLDPRRRLNRPNSSSGTPLDAALVSGRVDTECSRAWAKGYDSMLAQGIVGEFRFARGPLEYCNRTRGFNLTNVIVSMSAEASK